MEDLRLVVMNRCPFCKKVEYFLSKNNLQDKVRVESVDDTPGLRDEVLEKGGMAQYPVLIMGDEAMYESMDIIQYFKDNLL